jgi:hypothetical protein
MLIGENGGLEQFMLAFCNWYILELQTQKIHREILNLTHNKKPQAAILLARQQTYQILAPLSGLIKNSNLEIFELVNMQLRVQGLLVDNKYLPEASFNLTLELSKYLTIIAASQQSLLIAFIEQFYHSMELINLQQGFNLNYGILLAEVSNFINSKQEFNSFTHLSASFSAYPALVGQYFQAMHDALANIAHYVNDNKIYASAQKICHLIQKCFSALAIEKSTTVEPAYRAAELSIVLTQLHACKHNQWLNDLEVNNFGQLSPNHHIKTIVDSQQITGVYILSSYGLELIQVKPSYLKDNLDELTLTIISNNIGCLQDFTIAKNLLLNFISCYQTSHSKQLIIDCSEPATCKELIEAIFKQELNFTSITKRGKSLAIKAAEKLITIFPSIANLFAHSQNILNLGFIPSLPADDIKFLAMQTLQQPLLLDAKDINIIVAQLKFW